MFGTVLRDASFFGFCLVLFSLIGLPLARQLQGLRSSLLLAPVLGYGVVGVASTVLYVYGLSTRAIFVLTIASGVGLAILQRAWLRQAGRACGWGVRLRGARAWVLCIWICGSLLLLLPQWTGGIQFSLFQQNVNDTFGYLTSAEVFSQESYGAIRHAVDADFLRHPLWPQAQNNLSCRPTVMILYAVVGQFNPAAMHEMHYTFLVFFLSCAALAIAWLTLNLVGVRQKWLPIAAMLTGLGFAVGFWGQYALDINAWSQVASVPLMAVMVGLLMTLVGDLRTPGIPGQPAQVPWRNLLVVALAVAAAVYFYPESTVFHLVVLGPVALWCWCRGHRFSVVCLVGAVVAGLACSLAYFHGTLGFGLLQGKGPSANFNFWIQTARFYFGRDGWYDALEAGLRKAWETAYPGQHNDSVAQLAFARPYLENFFRQGDHWRLLAGLPFDAVTGLLGLFFLTPVTTWPWSLQLLCRGGWLAFAGILFVGGVRRLRVPREARAQYIVILLSGIFLVCGVLLLQRNFWAAGKAISYASPYLAVFFVLPALVTKSVWARSAAGVWLAAQLAFGMARPFWAHDPRLLGWTPTCLPASCTKTTCDFNLRPLLTQLRSASCVQLDIADPYLEHYAMLALYAQGIAFRFDHHVYTYFASSGRDVGAPVWTQAADWRVVMTPPATGEGLAHLVAAPLLRTDQAGSEAK